MLRRSVLSILNKREIFHNSFQKQKSSSFFNKSKKILLNYNFNYTQVRFLNENEYEKKVNEVLESINDCFEDLLENQTKVLNYDINLSDGVLTINLDSFGTYVLNKQTPNKQIWISSPLSGPKRYDYENGVWIYKHDNLTLHELLNHEIGSFFDLGNIDFTKCIDESYTQNFYKMGENQEFPYFLQGTVVKGYQRGTKDLGVPTANLDGEEIKDLKLIDGIYYGWAKIVDSNDSHAFMMCASIGKNPTYGNEQRSCEIHLLEKIEESLYGKKLKCIFAGFVRGQTKFNCLPDLVKAIENDIVVSKKELEKEQYFNLKIHEYLN